MAFVYCNDCNWQQDDFWSTDYYPNDKEAERILLDGILDPESRMHTYSAVEIEDQFPFASEDVAQDGTVQVDFKTEAANIFMNLAKRVLGMNWITEEDFKNDPNPRCPICGSSNLSID